MNFVDAVSKGALSGDLARKFVEKWASECGALTSCDEALGKLRPVRESDPDFLVETGHSIVPSGSSFFTVVRYDKLKGRLHEDTLSGSLSSAHSSACEFEGAVDEKSREILESRILVFQSRDSDGGFFNVKFKD